MDEEITSLEDLQKLAETIDETGTIPAEVESSDDEVEQEPTVDTEVKAEVEAEVAPEPVSEPDEDIPEDSIVKTEAPKEPVLDEVEAYTPNLSYNIKGEEKTFDERFKSVIKTKEDEEFVRDIYTRADGLDTYKAKLEAEEVSHRESQASLEDISEKYALSKGFYKDMITNRDSKNWRGVAKSIGYSDDDILDFALEIAKERELPEDQRAISEQSRLVAEQNRMLEANMAHNTTLLEQQQQNIISDRESSYVSQQENEIATLASGEYAPIASALAANGLNLRDEIINVGRGMVVDDVEPAVADVMKATAEKFKFMVQQEAPAEVETKQVIQRKDAIPSISGTNNNQVDTTVSSVDDLQKIVDGMIGKNKF